MSWTCGPRFRKPFSARRCQ